MPKRKKTPLEEYLEFLEECVHKGTKHIFLQDFISKALQEAEGEQEEIPTATCMVILVNKVVSYQ